MKSPIHLHFEFTKRSVYRVIGQDCKNLLLTEFQQFRQLVGCYCCLPTAQAAWYRYNSTDSLRESYSDKGRSRIPKILRTLLMQAPFGRSLEGRVQIFNATIEYIITKPPIPYSAFERKPLLLGMRENQSNVQNK